jgi:hypothetical protein
MGYFADLTPYSYIQRTARECELNVGWLDNQHPFLVGSVPQEVLSKVFQLCRKPVNLTRGKQSCDLCRERGLACTGEHEGVRLELGNGEIRVIGSAGKVYASPVMIYHYISEHKYLPPQEFIDAVLASGAT